MLCAHARLRLCAQLQGCVSCTLRVNRVARFVRMNSVCGWVVFVAGDQRVSATGVHGERAAVAPTALTALLLCTGFLPQSAVLSVVRAFT
jgi:hypothetical protein